MMSIFTSAGSRSPLYPACALLLLAMLLAGCGGSSGGGNSDEADDKADTTPDVFTFLAISDVDPGIPVTSNAITVSGIDAAASLSISGGEYAVNGGAFTAAGGRVDAGDRISVRLNSPASFATRARAILTISGVRASFEVTTRAANTVPDAFVFTARNAVARNSLIASDPVTVTGIEASSAISVSGGEYAVDAGAFTSAAGTVDNGQSVVLRLLSAPGFATASAATLTIGGVAASFDVVTLADLVAPLARIDFPPEKSLTESATVTVRGTASDDSGVAAVRVNGLDASSADEFAHWQVEVPLDAGDNSLVLEVIDTANNLDSNADQAMVTRTVHLHNARDSVLDAANSRLLLTHDDKYGVVVVSLIDGARSKLSGYGMPDFSTNISSPKGIALDAVNNRLLVTDNIRDTVYAVDRATGARSVFSSNTIPDAINPMDAPGAIVIDGANDRALLVNITGDEILALDLVSGARSVLSNNSLPDGINPLSFPADMVLDSANNRALVLDIVLDAVIAIDLDSGARTIVSDDTIPDGINPLTYANALALDPTNDRLLALNGVSDPVIAIDLPSGARSILSSSTSQQAGDGFFSAETIAVDVANNRALVSFGNTLDALYAVSLGDGSRTLFSGAHTPGPADALSSPSGLALDRANNRVLVTDSRRLAVIAVDAETGARTQLTLGGFLLPDGIAVDGANDRALVTDVSLNAVFAMDLDSADLSVLSGAGMPDNNNLFVNPKAIALDSANNRALVVDQVTLGPNANFEIKTVDLATGARGVLSSNSVPNGDNRFDSIREIVIDAANNRALVTDLGAVSIIAVDLDSGARSVLSSAGIPDNLNRFEEPFGLALDAANNRALVSDLSQPDAVYSIDLDTGARSLLSSSRQFDAYDDEMSTPYHLDFDSERGLLLVSDKLRKAIFVIDPQPAPGRLQRHYLSR